MHNTAEIEQTFRDAIGGESAPIVALDYITIRGQDFDTTLTEFSVPIHFLRNSEIRQLRHMTDLTFLSLSPQQFDDLSPISGLTNLTGLDLGAYEGGQINDLSPIFGLTSLESLNLFNNNVSDTSSLSEFTSLTVLQMGRNGVNNLTGLYRTAQPLYEYV
jgi:Leucine-rich repeat (LRR) protein